MKYFLCTVFVLTMWLSFAYSQSGAGSKVDRDRLGAYNSLKQHKKQKHADQSDGKPGIDLCRSVRFELEPGIPQQSGNQDAGNHHRESDDLISEAKGQ